jgi:hypothetical protein
MLWVLLTALPLAALWVAGAAGVGVVTARLLLGDRRPCVELQLALGVAVMLWLDAALGRLGVLSAAGGGVAWALPVAGAATAIWCARDRRAATPPALLLAAVPALAVLVVACCSAPGWLWRSEFGGYDALSYHLQLPGEWLAAGRVFGPEHNVYGFLPGYVEAAYLHLAILRGDPVESAPAAQFLHALLAVLTAVVAGRVVRRVATVAPGDDVAARTGSAAATALLLATPWIVVVGALAYDELAVTLLLSGGLLVLTEPGLSPARRGAVVGGLAAVACGAKLTAVGLVALPLGAGLVATVPPRRWLVALPAGAAAGLAGLAPWLLGNLVQTGNPVFPFLTGALGPGHWSPEQAAIWAAGHGSDASAIGRVGALWNQWLRFGLGANPQPGEPWLVQWAALPWLGLAALSVGLRGDGPPRRWSALLGTMLAVQLVFWATATHLQSRFLLPTAVPLAILGGLAVARSARGGQRARAVATAGATALVLVQAVTTAVLFRGERGGSPAAMVDGTSLRTGNGLAPSARAELGAVWPEVQVNHLLPDGSLVLLVGEAAPFYYRLERIRYQTTWDRGPLSAAMAASPDDPAAWMEHLRRNGFTHMLVRPEMLERWTEAGWGDPALTADAVLSAARAHATLRLRFPGGIELYELE